MTQTNHSQHQHQEPQENKDPLLIPNTAGGYTRPRPCRGSTGSKGSGRRMRMRLRSVGGDEAFEFVLGEVAIASWQFHSFFWKINWSRYRGVEWMGLLIEGKGWTSEDKCTSKPYECSMISGYRSRCCSRGVVLWPLANSKSSICDPRENGRGKKEREKERACTYVTWDETLSADWVCRDRVVESHFYQCSAQCCRTLFSSHASPHFNSNFHINFITSS